MSNFPRLWQHRLYLLTEGLKNCSKMRQQALIQALRTDDITSIGGDAKTLDDFEVQVLEEV